MEVRQAEPDQGRRQSLSSSARQRLNIQGALVVAEDLVARLDQLTKDRR